MATYSHKNDTIITGTSYNDNISNYYSSNITINVGEGNDVVYNFYGSNVVTNTSDGDDSIKNERIENATINAGAGNDTIDNDNSGITIIIGSDDVRNALINAGDGNDIINNRQGSKATIIAGKGDDSIQFGANSTNILIYSEGDGNDTISVVASSAKHTIQIDTTEQPTSVNSGDDLLINVGDGSMRFIGMANQALNVVDTEGNAIEVTAADTGNEDSNTTTDTVAVDNVSVSLTSASVNGYYVIPSDNTSTNPTATFTTDSSTGKVVGTATDSVYTAGNDYAQNITVTSNNWSITATANDDTIRNQFVDNATIDGGAGNDHIENWSGNNLTIDGGTGDDYIRNGITGIDGGSNIKINGGNGNDSISNWNGTNVTINAGAGDDAIENYGSSNYTLSGSYVSISGGNGKDDIKNYYGNNVTIDAGDGNDSIENDYGNNVSINAGADNDTIQNFVSNNVTIDAGDGDDSIRVNSSSDVTITGGSGSDTIVIGFDYGYGTVTGLILTDIDIAEDSFIFGNYASITPGSLTSDTTENAIIFSTDNFDMTWQGYDSLTEDVLNFSVQNGDTINTIRELLYGIDTDTGNTDTDTGNDTVAVDNVSVSLSSASVNGYYVIPSDNTSTNPTATFTTDSSTGKVVGTANDSVYTAENDYAQNITVNSNWSITTTAENDYVTVTGSSNTIITGAGNDTIDNNFGSGQRYGHYSYILAGEGDDSIRNNGRYVTIDAGAGNDYVYSDIHQESYQDVTIFGGEGDDTLIVRDHSCSLNGGSGNDYISVAGSQWNGNTLEGGTGDDTLYGGGQNVFFYQEGDGNDIVYNFSSNDSIQVNSATPYTTVQSGNDIIVNIGSGSMRLTNGVSQLTTIPVYYGDTIYAYDITVDLNNVTESEKGVFITTSSIDADSNTVFSSDTTFMPLNDSTLYYNGHYYAIYSGVAETWEDAKTYAENLGGHLAVINDEAENTALYNYMTLQGYESAYFGLSDADSEGTWTWVNGDEVTYTNWADGEPNSENNQEDYAMFYYKYSNAEWNDGSFNTSGTVNDTKDFIVEWEDNLIVVGSVTADKVYVSESDTEYKQSITIPAGWSVVASENADVLNVIGNDVTVAGGDGNDVFSVASGVDSVVFADLDTSDDILNFEDAIPENSLSSTTSNNLLTLYSDDINIAFQDTNLSELMTYSVNNGGNTNTISELMVSTPTPTPTVNDSVTMAFAFWTYSFEPNKN